MRAGALRDKVTIKRKIDAQDDYGEPVDTTEKVYDAKADVRYMSGSDLIKAGVQMNLEVITVKMRFDKRLTHDSILETNGVDYNVNNIKPERNRREFIITASREL